MLFRSPLHGPNPVEGRKIAGQLPLGGAGPLGGAPGKAVGLIVSGAILLGEPARAPGLMGWHPPNSNSAPPTSRLPTRLGGNGPVKPAPQVRVSAHAVRPTPGYEPLGLALDAEAVGDDDNAARQGLNRPD